MMKEVDMNEFRRVFGWLVDSEGRYITNNRYQEILRLDAMLTERNIPALKEFVAQWVQMVTQKTAGQRKGRPKDISWDNIERVKMGILCEAVALVLSGALDDIEDREEAKYVGTWYDAETALPSDGEPVICWCKYSRYGDCNRMFKTLVILNVWNGQWVGGAPNSDNSKVLYWCRIPEPPEEVANEES